MVRWRRVVLARVVVRVAAVVDRAHQVRPVHWVTLPPLATVCQMGSHGIGTSADFDVLARIGANIFQSGVVSVD